MGDGSNIEWCDTTWNPLAGCEHAGPGCDRCYAARETFGRLRSNPLYAGLAVKHIPTGQTRFTGEIRYAPERLDQPSRWRRPRRIFVNSMSDLFHPAVEDSYIEQVFEHMLAADQHIYQVLTKRPQRMAAFTRHRFPDGLPWHIWLGTSIESPRYAFRARHAVESTTQVPWLSIEPLVAGILPGEALDMISGAKWVVLGGESGPGARPMHPTWVRTIRDVCDTLDVPFLFKQWGEWAPAADWPGPDHHVTLDGLLLAPGERSDDPQVAAIHRWGKHTAGRVLDGRTWDDYPERPVEDLVLR